MGTVLSVPSTNYDQVPPYRVQSVRTNSNYWFQSRVDTRTYLYITDSLYYVPLDKYFLYRMMGGKKNKTTRINKRCIRVRIVASSSHNIYRYERGEKKNSGGMTAYLADL